jgi:3-oxoacyl-[acyl-carrier protein] reductase
VAGASRGIGLGIAERLAAEGCHLAICAREEEPLARSAEALEGDGIRVLALPMDLTADGEAERLVEAAVEHFGRIDVLVGNVGGNRRKPFEETTDDDWEDILDLNLRAHIRCSRAAIPHMKAGGGGSIIFITSIFGREAGGTGLSIYNTTKSALISLSKIMALELAPHGIRVNNVAPGSIRFPGGSWDRRCIADPDGMAVFIEQNLPLGRFGTVEEVGNVVAFLASDCASLVTGTSLNADGGQSHSLI